MNGFFGSLLLILLTLGVVLPAFPILGMLEGQFPEVPQVFTIDAVAAFFAKAIALFTIGIGSMCIYSDLVCPWLIRGYFEIFSRME